MQVIRHQQEQLYITSSGSVISTRCFEDNVCDIIVTKLICASRFAANRNEIGGAKSSVEMDGVIESLPNGPRRSGVVAHGGRAAGDWVNRPYLVRVISAISTWRAFLLRSAVSPRRGAIRLPSF